MESNAGAEDRVLLQAWARLSVFDQTARDLKSRYINRRRMVIVLMLVTTIAAVMAGVMGQTSIGIALVFISLATPSVAALILRDVVKFTGATAWIKYRYLAEMLRMHIYLYRMNAGEYAEIDPTDRDDHLVSNFKAVIESVKPGIVPTTTEPQDEDKIRQFIKDANQSAKEDNGLSTISPEDYRCWRIKNQIRWYEDRINNDTNLLKFFDRGEQMFLIFSALLSLLAAFVSINVITVVAITNAIAATLVLWAGVQMVGTTYSLFQIASEQLSNLEMKWDALANNPSMKDETSRNKEIARLVHQAENILNWERQEWLELVLQAQATGDKAILNDLERLKQRAQDAQKTQASGID